MRYKIHITNEIVSGHVPAVAVQESPAAADKPLERKERISDVFQLGVPRERRVLKLAEIGG